MTVNPKIRQWKQTPQVAKKTRIHWMIAETLVNRIRRHTMMRDDDRLSEKGNREFARQPLHSAAMLGQCFLGAERHSIVAQDPTMI
jgi:hypothetical protein